MILVDTPVWIDHWRSPLFHLIELLSNGEILIHPMVIGELACGNIRDRQQTIRILNRLPRVSLAGHTEVIDFIDARRLMGRGIGYIDVHLLASALLGDSTKLWTFDRRLHDAAVELGIAYEIAE